MGWRLLDKGCSLERGVQYKPKRVGAGGGGWTTGVYMNGGGY